VNDRERFHATMHYQPRDRSPICDFGFWDETFVVWRDQGLPESVNHANTAGCATGWVSRIYPSSCTTTRSGSRKW
jgi:hypothetical protein